MRKGHKLVTVLISLLGAILLWLYVVSSVAPEATTRVSGIPINIDGTIVLEERGLIITAQDVSSLSLEVSTSRVNLSKLNAETIRVNADASRLREPGQYALTCTVTFPDTVRSSEVDLLRKSVDSVTVTVARLETKTVPLELEWTGSVKEGYLFESGNVSMEPAAVTVTGPAQELALLESAVVTYDVSELEETAIEEVPIQFLNQAGEEVTFSQWTTSSADRTTLTLPVFRTREITLALDFLEGGGVTSDNVRLTLEPQTIHVKGAAEVVDAMEDPLVLATVDLATVSNREEKDYPLNLPAGVTNISGETEIHSLLLLVGVRTDSVPVSDIRLVNAPEGFNTELSTRTVQVTVRGSEETIQNVKNKRDNGIYILVDLEDYTQAGAYLVPGKVVNETYEDLSVADTVEIGVIISARPEPTEEEQGD